jgi:hypothetical protein
LEHGEYAKLRMRLPTHLGLKFVWIEQPNVVFLAEIDEAARYR